MNKNVFLGVALATLMSVSTPSLAEASPVPEQPTAITAPATSVLVWWNIT